MTRIALVVSDVDGTLLTKDKVLTDGAKAAVRKLHDGRHRLHHRLQPADHRHGFSDRAAFDHASRRRLQRQLDRRRQAQADRAASDRRLPWRSAASTCSMRSASISGCSPTTAGTRAIPTANTSRTRSARSRPIRPSSRISRRISTEACKIVGASSDAALLQRCEAAMQEAVGPGGDRGPFANLLSRHHAARS